MFRVDPGEMELNPEFQAELELERQAEQVAAQAAEAGATTPTGGQPGQAQPQQPATAEQQAPWQQGFDLGDAARQVAEGALAIPTGVLDFGVDLINKLPSKEVEGMVNPFRPGGQVQKLPEFQTKHIQAVREIGSVVVPTYFLGRSLLGAGAAAQARVGWSIGNNAFVKALGTLGIEAARFYLISKYNESDITSGGNPVNIELLIDYQTTLGRLLPVSFIGVNKAGGSILSEVGFEQAMDVLQRNSAFGNIDNLKGLTGSVMTGKFCHNGTGFSNITYDKEYLKDEDNKRITGEENKNIPLETDFVVGPCYKTISEDLNIDYKRKDMQDDINFNLPEEGKESELCLKENIPDPPRMEAPEIFSPVQNEEVDIQLPEKENYDVFADLEIPEDPGELESDYF